MALSLRSGLLVTVLTVALMIGALTFAMAAPAAAAQSTVNVSVHDFAFNPSTITVVIGVNNTVTWTNLDSVTHTVTSNTGAFNGPLSPGQSFTFTFTTPGTYAYHCSIHTYMKGTVVVEGVGSATTSSTTTTTTSSTTSTTSSSTATSVSTTPTSTTSSSTSTAQSPSTTTTTSNSSGGGIPEFPFEGALVAGVALAVVVSYLLIRQTGRERVRR